MIFKKMLINICAMGIIVPSEKRLFCVEEAGTKLLKEKKYQNMRVNYKGYSLICLLFQSKYTVTSPAVQKPRIFPQLFSR